MTQPDAAVRERVAQVERQLADLERRADPDLREVLESTLTALLALHGEGLERILRHAERAHGEALWEALTGDEWVAQLLLLHGLHPDSTAERVERALDGVRPDLHAHGGDVELLGVEGGVVRLRLHGTCNGCPASAETLRSAIESAVAAAAPEVERVEAEGVAAPDLATTLAIAGAPGAQPLSCGIAGSEDPA